MRSVRVVLCSFLGIVSFFCLRDLLYPVFQYSPALAWLFLSNITLLVLIYLTKYE